MTLIQANTMNIKSEAIIDSNITVVKKNIYFLNIIAPIKGNMTSLV